jgi:hypothetical protein
MVPLDTVTLPTLPNLLPMLATTPVTLPPVTSSVAVPSQPTWVKLPFDQVPLLTVTDA